MLMRGENQRGSSCLKIFENFPEVTPSIWIKSSCWFVENEDSWIWQNCNPQGKPLPLSSGELDNPGAALAFELNDVKDLACTLFTEMVKTGKKIKCFLNRQTLLEPCFL